jgi:hypothetical protein
MTAGAFLQDEIGGVRHALVCIHRHERQVSHEIWGGVPDVTLAVLPKYARDRAEILLMIS